MIRPVIGITQNNDETQSRVFFCNKDNGIFFQKLDQNVIYNMKRYWTKVQYYIGEWFDHDMRPFNIYAPYMAHTFITFYCNINTTQFSQY